MTDTESFTAILIMVFTLCGLGILSHHMLERLRLKTGYYDALWHYERNRKPDPEPKPLDPDEIPY